MATNYIPSLEMPTINFNYMRYLFWKLIRRRLEFYLLQFASARQNTGKQKAHTSKSIAENWLDKRLRLKSAWMLPFVVWGAKQINPHQTAYFSEDIFMCTRCWLTVKGRICINISNLFLRNVIAFSLCSNLLLAFAL